MVYKNISNSKKIFYGVTFNPGDIKEVPGYINDRQMIVSKLKDTKVFKQQNKKSNINTESVDVNETEQNIKEDITNG